jgi:excisionase family DNA binding protein
MRDAEHAHVVEEVDGAIGVSVETAAKLMSISTRKMGELVAKGEIPSRTIGNRRIIRRSALEQYLREGEIGEGPCSEIEQQVFAKPAKSGRGVIATARGASINRRTTGTGRRS